MNNTEHTNDITKRVVFTMGGKGGVGKTGCMLAIAEWFEPTGSRSHFWILTPRTSPEAASSTISTARA